MNARKMLAGFLLCGWACAAPAAVVVADKYESGDEGVLFDTGTGLDWARGPTGTTAGP